MRIRNLSNKDSILKNSSYVISDPLKYKGKWHDYFGGDNPIYLEIGTGKCKFIYNMAKNFPDINFIGVERIDTVLAYGVKELMEQPKLDNLVLINYDAFKIDEIFSGEIDEVFLNFSDPWPKKRHEKRRLTSLRFLKKYDIIFSSDKCINFKTDNKELFEYSIVSLSNYGYKIVDISLDLHKRDDIFNVVTEYEEKFSRRGENICYLKAKKNI